MDRRDFFRRSMGKATEVVVKSAEQGVVARAKHWIRPPFALTELEFLLACTRCNACIEACPHNVIFPLPSRLGPDVLKTPALDLLTKGCQLCEDWPCVNACEPGALVFPDESSKQVSKFARADIIESLCLPFSGPECGACVPACPVEGALTLDREKPLIDQELCVGCALCREACIVEEKAIQVNSV